MKVPIGVAAKEAGVTTVTLRVWEKAGKIVSERTKGGHRRYDLESILTYANRNKSCEKVTAIYARVSTPSRKNDLDMQKQVLQLYCASKGWKYKVIEDIGSGLNYNKKGLLELIKLIETHSIERIVLNYKDRLLRFGSEIIFEICKYHNIEVVILTEDEEKSEEKSIGIDKGYRCLIATSENKFYGEKLNDFLSKETERLNQINAKRNRLWALIKKYEKEGNTQKADNIKRFNMGKVKYNRNKNRFDSQVKSYINREINRFIANDNPSELIMEDLSFVSWKDKLPAHIKRKLSRWIKGYIRERLNYKSNLNNIDQAIVNAAYTSQVCYKCGRFGVRNNEVFTCPSCGIIDADYNASKNIEARKEDKEITLYTPYKEVKEILIKRCPA